MTKRRPYQFSIGRLLVLSTAVAGSLVVARGLASEPVLQAILGVYFALLVAWVVMRWPAVSTNLREVRKRRQELLTQRAAMVADANESKKRNMLSISQLQRAIDGGEVRITDHADEEMASDQLVLDDVIASVSTGEIIEQYPADHPLPSCLVYGQSKRHVHIHSVWAYNGATKRAVLVTVYRPDPDRWIDWRSRKKA